MRRYAWLAIGVSFMVLVVALGARGVNAQSVQLFGGYSYVRASVPETNTIACPGPTCPITNSTYHPNLNGWELSGTYKPGHLIGFTADFSGHYGSIGSSSTHLQTYLFGPTVSLPGPISPFVHVLVGVAHERVGEGSPGGGLITLPTTGNAFAAAIGGGIDVKVMPFVAWRAIQVDYLATRFTPSTQNQPRISTGIVLRF